MPVAEFVAEETACGRSVLGLVSRAHVILAEMYRLQPCVPTVFCDPPAKYAPLLPDFTYFNELEAFDKRLDSDEALKELDDELRENYVGVVSKLMACFESIHRYAVDLNRFIEELEEGFYVQRSLETVFANHDGKQLMCEALYLYGVILLSLDILYQGSVRERILVAYHRMSAESWAGQSSMSDVCSLLRSTGYNTGAKRPNNYPENLFTRVPINSEYVAHVITALRSEDMYSATVAFPLSSARSTALATQAAMIVVCLYFRSDILKSHSSAMREIVDKFFNDNWVINVYMGSLVNLFHCWEPYEAAKAALNTCINTNSVKSLADKHGKEMNELTSMLSELIDERGVNKETVVAKSDKLIKLQRRCNVCLRWMHLHTYIDNSWFSCHKQSRTMHQTVMQATRVQLNNIFHFLLLVSQFEAKFKQKLKVLLDDKVNMSKKLQEDIAERLGELGYVFSGEKPLTRVEKKEKLRDWFRELKDEMMKLDLETNPQVAYSKLVQISRALQHAEEMYTMSADTTVSQFMVQLRHVLKELMALVALKEDTLVMVETVADMSYAWSNVSQYVGFMQEDIKRHPEDAVKLRATFLKLATSVQVPLVRLQQAQSWGLLSISSFYSRLLVDFMRSVLQIVPTTVFALLAQIAAIHTCSVPQLPTRVEKDRLKEHAQPDARMKVASLTHDMSVLTEGVLMLKTMTIGMLTVQPTHLLHDGLRKELVKLIATNLNTILSYDTKPSKDNRDAMHLAQLSRDMAGLRRSLTYMSDYMGMSGWKIWHEEFSRVVNYYVELECNALRIQKVVSEEDSLYQSHTVPIPVFPQKDALSKTCIGRLTRFIVATTEPKDTIYIKSLGTWYDCKTKHERVNPNLFIACIGAVNQVGVCGMAKLLGCMTCQVMLRAHILIRKQTFNIDANLFLDRSRCISVSQDLSGLHLSFLGKVLKIGQLVILRSHMLVAVASKATFQCNMLVTAACNLNSAVMHEMQSPNGDNAVIPADSPLLYELSTYLDAMGLTDSFAKFYMRPSQMETFVEYMTLAVMFIASKFASQSNIQETCLPNKTSDHWDLVPLVVGCGCVLGHWGDLPLFVSRCTQFVDSVTSAAVKMNSEKDIAGKHEANFITKFLSILSSYGFISAE